MAFLNFLLSPCYKSGGHFRPLAYNGLQPYAGRFSQLALRVLLALVALRGI